MTRKSFRDPRVELLYDALWFHYSGWHEFAKEAIEECIGILEAEHVSDRSKYVTSEQTEEVDAN